MRLREMEQKELERQYGKKKAKEVAQQKFNVSNVVPVFWQKYDFFGYHLRKIADISFKYVYE